MYSVLFWFKPEKETMGSGNQGVRTFNEDDDITQSMRDTKRHRRLTTICYGSHVTRLWLAKL